MAWFECGSGGSGGSSHSYSTTEQIVGTWVDGSPIYEKTFYHAGAVQGNFDITHNISNLSRVINYQGSALDSQPYQATADFFVFTRAASDGYNLGVDFVTDTIIRIVNPSAFGTRLYDWYVTLQYTKSSS